MIREVSISADTECRISHDVALVKKLIQVIAPDVENCTVKVLRIGKANRGVKTLKVIYDSDAIARRVSKKFSKEKAEVWM